MDLQPATLLALFGGTALAAVLALVAVLSRKGRTEDQARAYLAGFTYVLSDDPDAAIAELSKAAQINTQTVETYFALGALFRRKGELERAIRLHSNLLLRPGLSQEVRRRAQLALALDYKRSRLVDKAAEAFERLLADDPDHREALLRYRQVLEESRDWNKAIEVQARLVQLEGKGEEILAHLLAEASRGGSRKNPTEAQEFAVEAVRQNPDSADAQLALGQALLELERGSEAMRPLRQALILEPELAPKAVALLARATRPPEDVESFLLEQMTKQPASRAPFGLALALYLKDIGSTERAIGLLRSLMERMPRFWEARKELGPLLLAQNRAEDLRAEYQDILATLGQPVMGFACRACRQRLPEHVFRCPACESWDTVTREE